MDIAVARCWSRSNDWVSRPVTRRHGGILWSRCCSGGLVPVVGIWSKRLASQEFVRSSLGFRASFASKFLRTEVVRTSLLSSPYPSCLTVLGRTARPGIVLGTTFIH